MHLAAVNLSSHITYVPVDGSLQTCQDPSADSSAVPFQTCTPHDHSYSVEDILQIILKSRKNWKTLKGQSEAVWPPYLEAIMLKALQEYEPDDSRETRILGRYPMRNRFISDYIHSATGKYRSAKQVGSRLQQLRDTPEGRQLIDALTRCYRTRMDIRTCNVRQPNIFDSSSTLSVSTISCGDSSRSSSASPATPTSPIMRPFPSARSRQPAEPRMPVYIDLAPQSSHSSQTGYSPSSTSSASMSDFGSRPSDAPRHIRNIDPTVTFVSPFPVNGRSSYIVLLDGAPVHMEDTKLVYVGPYLTRSASRSPGSQPVLYNTPLVPKYWDVLCEAADPTLYTIVQDVYHVPDHPSSNQDHTQRPRPALIFSAIYHFQYNSSGDPAASYGPLMDVSRQSSSGPSVSSTLGYQRLQSAAPVNFAQTSSFPAPSAYTFPAPPPTESEQNLFDGPFMLDVNFEQQQFAFDDLVASMDNPNTFFM